MTVALKQKNVHTWSLDIGEHYVEPQWCSTRLFEVERFSGTVLDPCAGFGRIPAAARAAGLQAIAGDIVDRGCVGGLDFEQDFFSFTGPQPLNIVFNPPFTMIRAFVERALALTICKVAAIIPTGRLNAAGPKWLKATPLYRIYYLSPRPSMPPGSYLAAGGKPAGDKKDYAWLVWLQGFAGAPTAHWLQREKTS